MTPTETHSGTATVMVAVAHDPEGRILARFDPAERILRDIFDRIGVIVTPGSTRGWDERDGSNRISIVRSRRDDVGENRREALDLGRQCGAASLLCVDLDRAVHWARTRSPELNEVASRIGRTAFTAVGRTEAAFASHPLCQQLTERATNEAVSGLLGLAADVTSGCCAMTGETAQDIVRLSTAVGVATDAEWPLLVALRLGRTVGDLRVDGLDFETADYFQDEIEGCGGRDAWLAARYGSVDAWRARLTAATATVGAASAFQHP